MLATDASAALVSGGEGPKEVAPSCPDDFPSTLCSTDTGYGNCVASSCDEGGACMYSSLMMLLSEVAAASQVIQPCSHATNAREGQKAFDVGGGFRGCA
mmetsp:Transcript_36316/g.83209  ORF Transcript_36316/g.83209 Transcript_36316/m.83209 type:complete len:99 (+) Transcript_36316:2087-2383(+)